MYVNDRTAAAWRAITKASASSVPPEFIYKRKLAVQSLARFQTGRGETKFLDLYNVLGMLFGFSNIQDKVKELLGEEGQKRFLDTYDSIQEADSDVGHGWVKILVTDDDYRKLFKVAKDGILTPTQGVCLQ